MTVETGQTLNSLRRICIYGGSSDTISPVYTRAAADLGKAMASEGISAVFGGGKTGMMGALADAMRAENAEVIGIIPAFFNTPELSHQGVSEMVVTTSMHERKAMMADMADAFIALPGGLGTYDELFEILTWAQIGLHSKPVAVFNVNNYFDPLLSLLDHSREHGFMYEEHRFLLLSGSTPEELLDGLRSYHPPEGLDRWVSRDDLPGRQS